MGIFWGLLLARIYEIFPLRCTRCGAQMRIIAFLTEPPAVKTVLRHLGEPITPPEVARARGPPLWDESAEFLPHGADSPVSSFMLASPSPADDRDPCGS